ncbi:MAG TPA: DNA polymerase III subunit delta' [Pseudomonas xinjiangensis]|uniref:DNA polymerase III subunit delta' n=2 Tax=root TaxID=1 RepID=A0A7V1BS35_9GAMM|nr:DNA polymerase III subunit delta' [Halopseudomonas xinjiangensis]HEC46789.1 DNA polymerase III subunit delta' [Halopseudomonas xinjiangensis]
MLEQARLPCPWHMELYTALVEQPQHAHAYLFAGLPGVGKRRFAYAFAAALLCLAPERGVACDHCRSCLLRKAGSHPDALLVVPEEDGKAIRVDAVRQLSSFLSQTAQQGGRKVIVLHPAEAMNQNAANALLKSLEEPTRETYLLLVSDQPSRLLPTIRSRCLVQPLPTPAPAEALAWLGQCLPELDDTQRHALLSMTGGAPLRALTLQEIDALGLRSQAVQGVKALLKNQDTASQLAERWSAIPLELLVEWFCSWTLDLLKLKTGAVESADNVDMDKVLGYMALHLDTQSLMNWQSWLLEHRGKILAKANLNRVLFIETMLIQWKQLLERR